MSTITRLSGLAAVSVLATAARLWLQQYGLQELFAPWLQSWNLLRSMTLLGLALWVAPILLRFVRSKPMSLWIGVVVTLLAIVSLLIPPSQVCEFDVITFAVTPALACIALYLIRRGLVEDVATAETDKALSYDESVRGLADDQLNRAVIAKRIHWLIAGAPRDASLRIGVYGGWGEGKTSLMRMIADCCQHDDSILSVWFDPWRYRDEDALWAGFRATVERAVLLASGGAAFPTLSERIRNTLYSLLRHNVPRLAIGRGLDELTALAPAHEPTLDQAKRVVQDELLRWLGNRRLVIFIDDLDRVPSSQTIRHLLMAVKELLEFKQVIYVLGLDPNVIGQALSGDSFFRPEDAGAFLAKIVDYGFSLPLPSPQERNSYLKYLLKSLNASGNSVPKPEVVQDIEAFLPSNPRLLKRFLYYIASLSPLLSRFEDAEFNWSFFFLAQLLGYEFPSVLRAMMADYPRYGPLFTYEGWSHRRLSDEGSKTGVEGLIKLAPEEEQGRLEQLLTALLDRARFNYDDAAFYFRAVEYPGLMSWKEFREVFTQIETRGIDVWESLDDPENQREYVRKLIMHRAGLHHRLTDSVSQEAMATVKASVLAAGDQLVRLLSSNLMANLGTSYQVDLFSRLHSYARSNAHFRDPIYTDIRKQDADLLRVASRFSSTNPREYLRVLKPWLTRDFPSEDKPLDIEDQIVDELKQELAKQILDGFRQDGFVLDLISREDGDPEEWLMLNLSVLHTGECLTKLKDLAVQAHDNTAIQHNFYHYLLWLSESHNNALLQNLAIIRILWDGATAGRLNRRMAGTLDKEVLPKIQAATGKHLEEVISYPSWWHSVLEGKGVGGE